jgi:glycosyl transferase/beta-hydroxylase protein BlmF
MKKVLIKFPVRERVEKVKSRINEIFNSCVRENTEVLLSIDTDDAALNNKSFYDYLNTLPWRNRIKVVLTAPKGKIHAVNVGLELPQFKSGWDIVVVFSDDMTIVKHGFDEVVVHDMEYTNYEGALWYSDGFTHNRLCTYPVLSKKYYDMFGYIYHPDYKSLFADNEQTEVGQKLNLLKYINEPIFRHDHHSNTNSGMDELLRKNESFWSEDEKTYNERKKKNFDLPC